MEQKEREKTGTSGNAYPDLTGTHEVPGK